MRRRSGRQRPSDELQTTRLGGAVIKLRLDARDDGGAVPQREVGVKAMGPLFEHDGAGPCSGAALLGELQVEAGGVDGDEKRGVAPAELRGRGQPGNPRPQNGDGGWEFGRSGHCLCHVVRSVLRAAEGEGDSGRTVPMTTTEHPT